MFSGELTNGLISDDTSVSLSLRRYVGSVFILSLKTRFTTLSRKIIYSNQENELRLELPVEKVNPHWFGSYFFYFLSDVFLFKKSLFFQIK